MGKKKAKVHSGMSRKSKAIKQQKEHVKERFLERFGIYLSNKKRYHIIEIIQKGKASFIEKSHGGRKIYGIGIEGEWVHVVYDPVTENIVTVLPNNEVKNEQVEAISSGTTEA